MKRLLIAVFTASLVACASQPADQESKAALGEAARYTSQPGESPVGVIPVGTIRDARRNKDLELYIEYPTKGGPHPLLIFSHRYGSSSRGYVSLSSHWASHGYVVIKPSHADTGKLAAEDVRDPAKLTENLTPAEWQSRVDDIRLIIDSLTTLEQQYPELQGKIDHARIGLGGHGAGAFTALLLGGMRTFSGATPTSYADPRVKAVIAMSPAGPTESLGLTRESWTEVQIPVLFMTGSNDRGASEAETPDWRRQAYELSATGDKWFVSIAGASTFTFTGVFRPVPVRDTPSSTPIIIDRPDPRYPNPPQSTTAVPPQGRDRAPEFLQDRNAFAAVRTISMAFWDSYLQTDQKGKEYLMKLSTRGDLVVANK